MIGQDVSHYRVLSRLGEGGMGEVFLAEDLRLHRPVALKMLRSEAQAGEARARLLKEARAASALSHPGIAVIYEVDEVERDGAAVAFIAMEYVAGATLGDWARREQPDLDGVLEVAAQVADALAEAHARGVIHRDVKPSNIVVSESGRVKVLDFGLAEHHPLAETTTSTWSREPAAGGKAAGLSGTFAYMSPEQALGKELDARSDVFSLGVVFYELLAGQPPFGGESAVAVLDAVLHDDPPALPPRAPDPRLPEVERIVRRMLMKDRGQRYASLREVGQDLAAVRAGQAPAALAPRPGAPLVAVLGFANITRNAEDEWLGAGIAETVTADLKNVEGLAVVGRDRIHEALRRLGAPGAEGDERLAARVGRAVGARWVVGGAVQRLGEVVRVTARLGEVDTGALVRTVKIDGQVSGIFELQDRIVRELSAGLRMTLAPGESTGDETQVVAAYEAFSKGVLNLRNESHESLDRAILFFERAVALDPGYARAHLELGSVYSSKAEYLGFPELLERAVASLRRALELRPRLVRAWRELGGTLVALNRVDEGIEAIRKALDLEPDNAGALGTMGRALFIGKAQFREAAGYYERALARNPQAGWYHLQLAHCAALVGDFARGEAAARRAAELQEAFLSGQEGVQIVGSYMRLGHLAALQGRDGEAVERLQQELAFLQRVDHALRARIFIELHMRLGAAQQRLGRREAAAAAFATAVEAFERRVRMGADEPFTRYYCACVYALRGENEEALASLEKAAAQRRRYTVERARSEPAFESLRGEPRFRELIGSAG
jgi:TolB-like protein/predicted Ser/Thr protein kinase/Flp pilus assembly protein TadD